MGKDYCEKLSSACDTGITATVRDGTDGPQDSPHTEELNFQYHIFRFNVAGHQPVMMLATQPASLSSIPRTHMVGRENGML